MSDVSPGEMGHVYSSAADARARRTIRRNPELLLRVFTLGSLIGILAILVLVGVAVHRIYYGHILRRAEVDAIHLGRAIFEQERGDLTAVLAGASPTRVVPPDTTARLDDRMRRYLRPLEIVKVKVFARDGTVVYSTDHPIIGQVDTGNVRLRRALAGEGLSSLKTAGRMWDLETEQRFDVDLVETYAPIREGGTVIGAFETYTDVTWSRNEIRQVLVLSIAVVLVVLLAVFGVLYLLMRTLTRELVEAESQLEQMAITDSLTGLANRRYIMARAEEECARVPRLGDKRLGTVGVGLIMADIDHFKVINDAHGHLVGDHVLRDVAARLRRATRKYDIVGRYGGEEFLVVLPQADMDEARAVAERIWQAVRERPFQVVGVMTPLTISVGVACITSGDEDVGLALKRADEALYLAKGAGRDRVAAV